MPVTQRGRRKTRPLQGDRSNAKSAAAPAKAAITLTNGSVTRASSNKSTLEDILENLGQALCLVETACLAFEATEEAGDQTPQISTLRLSVKHLKQVYGELDEAAS